jgi:hypothetical protein
MQQSYGYSVARSSLHIVKNARIHYANQPAFNKIRIFEEVGAHG